MQRADADEVTNDVLLRLLDWIGKFHDDRSNGKFRRYLATIIGQVASRHRLCATLPLSGLCDPESQLIWLDEAIVSNTLHLAREKVRDKVHPLKWNAFVMSYDDCLDDSTIAERLDRKIGWVYKAKHELQQRLKHWVAYFSEDAGWPGF